MNICEFKKIENFSNYFINKSGVIISTLYNNLTIIEGKYDKDGYRTVGIVNDDGERKHLRVGRLVGLTFLDNPNNFPVINHKNGDKTDDRLGNLEWTTISGNTLHGFRVLGRTPIATNNKPTTLKHKITGEILTFISRGDCAEHFNYSITHTTRLLNGKGNWEKSKFKDYDLIE